MELVSTGCAGLENAQGVSPFPLTRRLRVKLQDHHAENGAGHSSTAVLLRWIMTGRLRLRAPEIEQDIDATLEH